MAPAPEGVPASVRRYFFLLDHYGKEYDVNPLLLGAVMETESEGNPFAVGPSVDGQHAMGSMQFMPSTAQSFHLKNPYSVAQSLKAAAEMLHGMFERGMTVPQALAQYGGKPGNPLDAEYVRNVLSNYKGFVSYVKTAHDPTLPESFQNPPPVTQETLTKPPYNGPSSVPMTPVPQLANPPIPVTSVPPLAQEEQQYAAAQPKPGFLGPLSDIGVGFDHGILEALHYPIHELYAMKDYKNPFSKSPIPGVPSLPNINPALAALPPHKWEQFIADSVDHYYNRHKLADKPLTGELPNVAGNVAGSLAAIATGEGALDAAGTAATKLPLVGEKAAPAVETLKDILLKDAGEGSTAARKLTGLVARGASQGAMAGVASTPKGKGVGQNAELGAVDGVIGNAAFGLLGAAHGFAGGLLRKLLVKSQGAAEDAAEQRAAERIKELFPKGLARAVKEVKSYGPNATLYDTKEGQDLLKKFTKQPYLNGVLHDFADSRKGALTREALESKFLGAFGSAGPAKDAVAGANERAYALVKKLGEHMRQNPDDVHISNKTSQALTPVKVQQIANKAIQETRDLYGANDPTIQDWPKKLDPLFPADSLPSPVAKGIHDALNNHLTDLAVKGRNAGDEFDVVQDAKEALRTDLDKNDIYSKMMALSGSAKATEEAAGAGAKLISQNTPVEAVKDYLNKMTPEQKPIVLRSMVDAIHDKLFNSVKDAPQIASNMARNAGLRAKLTAASDGVPGIDKDVVNQLFQHMQNVSHLYETARLAAPKLSSEDRRELSPEAEALAKGFWERGNFNLLALAGTGVRAVARFASLHKDIIGDHAVNRLMSLPPEEAQQVVDRLTKPPSALKQAIQAMGDKTHVAIAHALLEQNSKQPNPTVPPMPQVPNFSGFVPSAQAMTTAAGQGLPVGLPATGQGGQTGQGSSALAQGAPSASGLPVAAPNAGGLGQPKTAPARSPAPKGIPAPAATHGLPIKGALATPPPLTPGEAKTVHKILDAQRGANSSLPINFNFTMTAPAPGAPGAAGAP